MKIMMLVPFDIFPPFHGTSILVYNLVKNLIKRHKLHLLLTRLHSKNGKSDIKDNSLSVDYKASSILDRYNMPSLLFNPGYLATACRIMRKGDFDIIHCEVLYTAVAGIVLKTIFKKPLVFMDHNCEYLKFRDLGKPWYVILAVKMIEAWACRASEKIIVLSEEDKVNLVKYINARPEKIEVIGPGLDLDRFSYSQKGRERIRSGYGLDENDILLSFAGTLETMPNIEAVRYISEYIYPSIKERYSRSKVVIMGRNSKHVLQYGTEGIIFTDFLEEKDYIDHLAASDVVMVPLNKGSGIRVKILEAAACSRAIVSTAKGAEGLSFKNDKELLVTPQIDDLFVKNIFRLLEGHDFRTRIGKEARNKMEAMYSWESKIEKFENIYKELTLNSVARKEVVNDSNA